MKRFCTYIGGAGLVIAAGLTTGTYGQDCACTGLGIVETEVCAAGDVDRANDGCNMATLEVPQPIAFLDATAATLPVEICGTSSTFVNGLLADTRDTDWILFSQAQLTLLDADTNGFVRLHSSLSSEFPGVTFVIGLDDDVAPGCGSTPLLGCENQIGTSAAGCLGGLEANAVVELAAHPNGVVVFVAPGNPDGSGIFTGLECVGGLNTWTLTVSASEPPTICGDPLAGPCNEANGTAGCDSADICTTICDGDPFCCDVEWVLDCASAAIASGCIPPPISCDSVVDPDTELTQSTSPDIVPGSVACGNDGGITTVENAFGRTYTLGGGAGLEIGCVAWAIEANSQSVDVPGVIVGLYDGVLLGNAPNTMTPLGVNNIETIPAAASGTFLVSDFGIQGLKVPAGGTFGVTIEVPDMQTITGIWPGSNSAGQSAPSYLQSTPCGLAAFQDIAAIGFPDMHLVNFVVGNANGGASCPWDCATSINQPDGEVNIVDLLELLGAWGGPGNCDFEPNGVIDIVDLLALLAAWGLCP